jgi:hypothetical protein
VALTRPHARYLLMGAVLVVIALVNATSFVLVRNAGSTLHDQASPRSMTIEQLRLDLADMNGAQTLYLIDPTGGRPVFLAARSAVRRVLAGARPLEQAPPGRRLLAEIASVESRFERVDGRIWAAVQSGQAELARALAAGVEASLYTRMRNAAAALERDATDRRTAALDSYNSRQALAGAAAIVLALVALAMTAGLLHERLRTGRKLDTTETEYRTLLNVTATG